MSCDSHIFPHPNFPLQRFVIADAPYHFYFRMFLWFTDLMLHVLVIRMLLFTLFFSQSNRLQLRSGVSQLFSISKHYIEILFLSDTFFLLPKLNNLTSPLSNINNETAEQRGPKQQRFMILFMIVEVLPTKGGIAIFFVASEKFVRLFYDNASPLDNGKNLATIHFQLMDRANAENSCPYFFSDLEDLQLSLDNIFTIGIYGWINRKLVPDDGETGAQSQKNASMWTPLPRSDGECGHRLKQRAPGQIGNFVLDSKSEGSTNASEPMEIFDNTPSEEIGEVQTPLRLTPQPRLSALWTNAGMSVWLYLFSRI